MSIVFVDPRVLESTRTLDLEKEKEESLVVVQKIEQNIVETNIPERGLETLEVPNVGEESLERRRMFDRGQLGSRSQGAYGG